MVYVCEQIFEGKIKKKKEEKLNHHSRYNDFSWSRDFVFDIKFSQNFLFRTKAIISKQSEETLQENNCSPNEKYPHCFFTP